MSDFETITGKTTKIGDVFNIVDGRIMDIYEEMEKGKVFGDIPVVSQVLQAIIQAGFLGFGKIAGILSEALLLIFPPAVAVIDTAIGLPVASSLYKIVEDMIDEPGVDTAMIKNIIKSIQNIDTVPNLFTAVFQFLFIMSFSGIQIEYATQQMKYAYNKKYRPNIIDVNALIRTAFIAPEKIDEVWNTLRMHGYPDNQIEMMFIASYTTYDIEAIKMLYLRGEISEKLMIERMRELGFTDTRIKELTSLWNVIPSIQDILYLVGKEAFEPDQIKTYGLLDEFPEEVSEWLNKSGLNRYWQEKYWAGHWSYPSPQMVFEMLHRRELTTEQVYEYMRVIEMPPYWRDMMMRISYKPLTRVDVRRMHKMGVLTYEEVVNAYRDGGYNEENAKRMADFTVLYNEGTERELSKAEILNGYKSGINDKRQTIELLKEIGYSDEIAEYQIKYADFAIKQSEIDENVSIIKDQFRIGVIDEYEANRNLIELEISSNRIHQMIESWKILRSKNNKTPSKTNLDEFLTYGIIDVNTYEIEMEKIGYSAKYIDWYLEKLMMDISIKQLQQGE